MATQEQDDGVMIEQYQVGVCLQSIEPHQYVKTDESNGDELVSVTRGQVATAREQHSQIWNPTLGVQVLGPGSCYTATGVGL